MSIYARVDGGVVQEIILPLMKDDGTEWPVADRFTADFVATLVDVTTVTPAPMPGWTYSGTSFSAPVAVAPNPRQIAQSAMAVGLAIVSTASPSLNGTYAIDALSQMDIIAIETSLNAGKGFPGGATTFNYADTSGVFHAFTPTNFTDFAAAVRDYVYALKSVDAGVVTTLPPSTVTIS